MTAIRTIAPINYEVCTIIPVRDMRKTKWLVRDLIVTGD